MKPRRLLACLVALACGCAEIPQDRASVPLYLAGTDLSEPIVAAGDVPVVVERADLAFGPLYLCAGANSGDLCETARLEWLETAVVDATDSAPASAGELHGVTGTVRSWMYDLAISSQLTRGAPFVLDAAAELGGASLVIEGRARVDDTELEFRAAVPIQQNDDTEIGVSVIRKSTSEAFFRDVRADESGLLVRFDPTAWVRGIDFRSYAPDDGCDEGEEGCAQPLTFEPDSQAYRSVRIALVSGVRPTFQWDYTP